jgi:hypothetical protein
MEGGHHAKDAAEASKAAAEAAKETVAVLRSQHAADVALERRRHRFRSSETEPILAG